MRFDHLPIRKIKPNPKNPRGINIRTQDRNLSYLKDSIDRFGVMVPIVVTPSNGSYLLIDGERRYHASKSLGLEKIPAYILEATDNASLSGQDLLFRMFQIHHLRDQWGPIQQCQALESTFARIMRRKDVQRLPTDREQFKRVVELLSELTGIDDRTASDRVKFLRWPEKIRSALYKDPDPRPQGYSYILEIEDKIIIPAISNYPEYFSHVSPDDIRFDLFEKLETALSTAQDVRRVAPFFRVSPKSTSDRKKVLKVLDNLRKDGDMTYDDAREELERIAPDVVRRDPPSPRKLVSLMDALTESLAAFDIESVGHARRRAKASTNEIISSSYSLKAALDELIDGIEVE